MSGCFRSGLFPMTCLPELLQVPPVKLAMPRLLALLLSQSGWLWSPGTVSAPCLMGNWA